MSEKSYADLLAEEIVKFVSCNLRVEVPEMNGVWIGLAPGDIGSFQQLTQEELGKRIRENVGIVVASSKPLTKKQGRQLALAIGDRFLKNVVGTPHLT